MIDLGTYKDLGDKVEVRFEHRFHYPIQRVWNAISDPVEIAKWMATGILEPQPGGKVALHFNHETEFGKEYDIEGAVRVFDPPRVLEYTWGLGSPPDIVRWELTPDGDGTMLTFTHLLHDPNMQKSVLPGWHSWIERLEPSLDQGQLPLFKLERWRDLYTEYWKEPANR